MANQITAVVTSDALRDVLHENAQAEYNELSWHPAADKLKAWYESHIEQLQGAAA